MPKKSTPQDKKLKSLERDGGNCYGENDKSSRKSIRRRKAIVNRAFRRVVKRKLLDSSAEPDALNDGVGRVKRPDWRKAPDTALGDQLHHRWMSQIIKRISVHSEAGARLLDDLELQLLDAGLTAKAVQDIMRQLHSVRRARWSTFHLESASTMLKIDYGLAKTIIDIFNRNQA